MAGSVSMSLEKSAFLRMLTVQVSKVSMLIVPGMPFKKLSSEVTDSPSKKNCKVTSCPSALYQALMQPLWIKNSSCAIAPSSTKMVLGWRVLVVSRVGLIDEIISAVDKGTNVNLIHKKF